LLFLSLFLVLLALVLFWLAMRQRRAAGLPAGRVIYADTNRWGKVEKPLYDAAFNLTGKPDYLVQQGEVLIPVEVKGRRSPEAPYDSHLFQLAAYCLLVERAFGKRPPHGILRYTNRTYAIDYTPELENALRDLLIEMRTHEHRQTVNRSHDSAARCSRCGFRGICDQKIGDK
jgi:CRISPR-associated exonuclease Cas4